MFGSCSLCWQNRGLAWESHGHDKLQADYVIYKRRGAVAAPTFFLQQIVTSKINQARLRKNDSTLFPRRTTNKNFASVAALNSQIGIAEAAKEADVNPSVPPESGWSKGSRPTVCCKTSVKNGVKILGIPYVLLLTDCVLIYYGYRTSPVEASACSSDLTVEQVHRPRHHKPKSVRR
jgi:hypothetical protein